MRVLAAVMPLSACADDGFWHPVAARPDRAELVVFPSVNHAEQTASVFADPGP